MCHSSRRTAKVARMVDKGNLLHVRTEEMTGRWGLSVFIVASAGQISCEEEEDERRAWWFLSHRRHGIKGKGKRKWSHESAGGLPFLFRGFVDKGPDGSRLRTMLIGCRAG